MERNILLEELNRIDVLIEVYSATDLIRVSELQAQKVKLELQLLDIMEQENNDWLNKNNFVA